MWTLRASGEAAAAAVPGASRARWLGRGRHDGVRHFAARNAEGQRPATRARLLRIMVPPVARALQWLHGSISPQAGTPRFWGQLRSKQAAGAAVPD